MQPSATTHGFTLLELMIALCIFTIISTGSYFMLEGIFTAQHHVEDRSDRLLALQRWLIISERDLMQLAPGTFSAPTDSEPKAKEPALSYSGPPLRLTFTRRGWSNPLGIARSELQRVEYSLSQDRMERRSIPMLPLASDTGQEKRPLLTHVQNINARFLDQTKQWQSSWAPPPEHLEKLPQAIELSVDIEGTGVIRQLFPIAGPADAIH